ncbi:cupin domain-containing protein [Neisseriaceae bacterium JH1-16]|nr:cupin domain-containing protein [Neisseriaceae bacterium JH1-16]
MSENRWCWRPVPDGTTNGPYQCCVQGRRRRDGSRYAISEWWLDPHTQGPGAHAHPEDDVFYVIAGTLSVRVGDDWVEAPPGAFVLVPGGMLHGFENRGEERAGLLNFSVPGLFETHMPNIAAWFAEHPPQDAGR